MNRTRDQLLVIVLLDFLNKQRPKHSRRLVEFVADEGSFSPLLGIPTGYHDQWEIYEEEMVHWRLSTTTYKLTPQAKEAFDVLWDRAHKIIRDHKLLHGGFTVRKSLFLKEVT
jgi:hypothetical protein